MNMYMFTMTVAAVLVGYFIAVWSFFPVPLKIEGTNWCLYGSYANMKQFSSSEKPPNVLIDITAKGVNVYEKCSM